jgi:mycothiol system anti-sigma-R factor
VSDEAAMPTPPWVASTVSCDDAVRQLYGYLDGELTEERRAAIAAHLDGCAPCIGAAKFEAELRSVIADRCHERVPDALRERVAASLRQEADGEG